MRKNCPRCDRAMTLVILEKVVTGTVWGWKCLHCGKALYPQWDEETAIREAKCGPRRETTQAAMAL